MQAISKPYLQFFEFESWMLRYTKGYFLFIYFFCRLRIAGLYSEPFFLFVFVGI